MPGLHGGGKRKGGTSPLACANRTHVNKKAESLRSRDVAYILDVSPNHVIDLVHRRKLEATKRGKFWRFRLRDVMAYKRLQKEP